MMVGDARGGERRGDCCFITFSNSLRRSSSPNTDDAAPYDRCGAAAGGSGGADAREGSW